MHDRVHDSRSPASSPKTLLLLSTMLSASSPMSIGARRATSLHREQGAAEKMESLITGEDRPEMRSIAIRGGADRCTGQRSSASYLLWLCWYVGVGIRSRRRGRQYLSRLLSKGPKCCRSLQRSRRSPSVGWERSVSVTTSSVLPNHAKGNRVPSHRVPARVRFRRGGRMWEYVVSADREHEPSQRVRHVDG
jgi:hypothetical protein